MPLTTFDHPDRLKVAAAGSALGALALLNVYVATASIETSPVLPPKAGLVSMPPASAVTSAGSRHTDPLSLEATTGRPLFHADRKPAPRDSSAATTPSDSNPSAFELVGLMENTEGARRAMIRSGEQLASWLGAGDQIDGWQVTSIESDQVILEAAGQRAQLKLYGRP